MILSSSPKVSICIPAYNQPECLRRTLESVVGQTFRDFEVIITDDTRDSSVADVAKEFLTDSRVKYFKNEKQLGSPANWNEAVRHARGEYIKFLHHDDWFKNEHSLGRFVELLQKHPGTSFAFSASLGFRPKEQTFFTHCPQPKWLKALRNDPKRLFAANLIGAPSATIYRKNLNIDFDEKLKWVVDIDFYNRALEKNKNFSFTPEPLVKVTSGAVHQITHFSQKNKGLEFFEWFYLYQKIGRPINFGSIKKIASLLAKYNVKSAEDIEAVTDYPIPAIARMIIFILPLIKLMPRGRIAKNYES